MYSFLTKIKIVLPQPGKKTEWVVSLHILHQPKTDPAVLLMIQLVFQHYKRRI